VISWPLGFVILALGKGRWFLLTETSFNLLHVALIALGLRYWGIEGVAIAFFIMYLGYILAVYGVSRYLTGFTWSSACNRIARYGLPALGAAFFACRIFALWPASAVGLALTLLLSMYCLGGLASRLGSENRIVRAIAKLTGSRLRLLPH